MNTSMIITGNWSELNSTESEDYNASQHWMHMHGYAGDYAQLNLTDIFGPQRDSLAIVVPVTVIYTLIFITGVVGNISTCIVIKKNRSMHTATNYYLFSLAISDFLLLLSGVPQEMYFIWSKWPYVFGEAFCIIRGIVAETSANATVLTITAFSMERYVAICHPFLAHAMSKLSRATRIILIVWMLSFISAIPQAAQFGIVAEFGVQKCAVRRQIIEHSFELATFIFFFAPMSIILILYVLIGVKLHQTNLMRSTNGNILYRPGNGSSIKSGSQMGTKRVLKMLVAVVIAFFICWAPFHAQRLVAVYGADNIQNKPFMIAVYNIMTYVSGVLYYLSTCINPLLYNIMSNKFREAFKETFQRFNVFTAKAHKPVPEYNILSRSKRLRVAFQESDYTSSSQREESNQSNTSWKFVDSITTPVGDRAGYKVSTSEADMRNNFRESQKQQSKRINPSRSQQSLSKWDQFLPPAQQQIVKIDEFDLPSKDASLNVLYTREGDIEIRLMRHKPLSGPATNPLGKLWSALTDALRSKSDSRKTGFYTPPFEDSMSLSSVTNKNHSSGGIFTEDF